MTLSHAHFLKLIHAEPDNGTHRLVYADWLEEQGDPLGEIVRLVVSDPSKLRITRPERIDELIAENLLPLQLPEPARLACLGACLCHLLFRQGELPMQRTESRAHQRLADLLCHAREQPIDPVEYARLRGEVEGLLHQFRLRESEVRKRQYDGADKCLLEACLGEFGQLEYAWMGYALGYCDPLEAEHEWQYVEELLREMVVVYWLALWGYQPQKPGY